MYLSSISEDVLQALEQILAGTVFLVWLLDKLN
jgi:hypothetical protein